MEAKNEALALIASGCMAPPPPKQPTRAGTRPGPATKLKIPKERHYHCYRCGAYLPRSQLSSVSRSSGDSANKGRLHCFSCVATLREASDRVMTLNIIASVIGVIGIIIIFLVRGH